MANQKQMARAAARQAAQEAQQRRKRMTLIGIGAALVLIVCVAIVLSNGGGTDAAVQQEPLVATHKVEINVADYGVITAELYGGEAPITVANFAKLADSGFYDGLTFHRIISEFMIQGGDPLGNGTGGADEDIKGEFAQNGVQNSIGHTRGVLSMARNSYDMDSASSQFFIVHQDSPHLNGSYAAFGKVVSGMEVVDAICEKTPVTDSKGTVLAENQPVITSITVTEIVTETAAE